MPKPTPMCMVSGCERPKLRPYHRCAWHYLKAQPIGDQIAARDQRLGMVPEPLRRRVVPARLWPTGSRWCSGCQSFVPDFYASGSRCKACASAASHSAMVKKTYGIEGTEYERLLALQGGRCAICRAKPKSKRLAVDHDHKSGAVRGLLCKGCNKGILGSAHDSLAILQSAVIYMNTPPASGAWISPESASQEEDTKTPSKASRLADPAGGAARPAVKVADAGLPRRTPYTVETLELVGGSRDEKGFYRLYQRVGERPPF